VSTTISRPTTSRLQWRRSRLLAGLTVLLAAGSGFAIVELTGPAQEPLSERAIPAAAKAWPGTLTAGERAAVAKALASRDARNRDIAASVAAGQAGALALADPATLYHHGVNTAATAPHDGGAAAAERFHHR
jgi:hypothetical protein